MSVSLKQSYDIEYNGTANVSRMDLFVDTAADLSGLTTFDSITLLQGSTAEDISTGDKYAMQTDGTWVKQPSQSAFANVYTKAEIDSMFYLYYTKTEADALFEWITATITTDTLPLAFIADGTPLISWSMLGNGSQQGTPTPDAPIMPEFVGVRTGNLWNYTIEQGGWDADSGTIPTKYATDNPKFTIRCGVADIIPIPSNTMSLTCPSGIKINFIWINTNGVSLGGSGWQQSGSTVTAPENAASVTFILAKVDDSTCSPNDFQNIMLNLGSTAKPYEPFGYKIPISCAGQNVPVYLGQTQTVRRIRKLVLTGEEDTIEYSTSGQNARAYYALTDVLASSSGISTHYKLGTIRNYPLVGEFCINNAGSVIFGVDISAITSAADFKSYLAQQYAAGHPVTVWYVLATPETGITNEPLAKIGDYADELSSEDAAVTIPIARGENTLTIGTTLQPSEITITGKIREVTGNEQ